MSSFFVCEALSMVFYRDDLMLFVFGFSPAFDIVQQRNGDGEAQSAACGAGVCEAVLHSAE